jgi:sec-independent protein translocase protein TatA
MPNVGPLELAVVLVIALVVLGPKRLPEVGRSLGKGIREFRDSLSMEGRHDDDDDEADVEEPPKALVTTAATAPAPPSETAETEPEPEREKKS